MINKLDNSETLAAIEKCRSQQKKIVFTNGCFDLMHTGHVTYLEEAKSLGDVLVVGINSDDSVKRAKGNSRPIFNLQDRATLLLALKAVDYVCSFPEDTPDLIIKQVKPDVLVKGGDWPEDKIVGADFVKSRGGIVKSLKFVDGYSTTSVIEKILSSAKK